MKVSEKLINLSFPLNGLDLAPIPKTEVAKVSKGLFPPPFFISLFE